MRTASQEKQSPAHNGQASIRRVPSIRHQPRGKRYYFDVGLGSVCLSGADTGGAFCLLEISLAPGMAVPRHTHTREDESYYVLSGELEVIVEDKVFVLRGGDSLIAPRDIPHQIRNSGSTENHYLLIFSPSGFESSSWRRASLHRTMRTPQRSRPQLPFGMCMNSQPAMGSFSVDSFQR